MSVILTSKEITDDAIKLIGQFQKGTIKPISCGDDAFGQWLNNSLLGGLLPGTICSISGPSGMGKTHLLQRIENHIIETEKDVVLLRVQWEGSPLNLILRKIYQKTGLKMKDVLFNKQTGSNLEAIRKVTDEERQPNVFVIQKILSSSEFYNEVSEFLKLHLDKKVVISLDHTTLVKGNTKEAVDSLFEAFNRLKREHPYCCFLPLVQSERTRLQERLGNHKTENPNRSDLYGSDGIYQLSDLVLFLYDPYKAGALQKYMVFNKKKYNYISPEFIIDGGSTWNHFNPINNIFYHLIKIRDINDIENIQDVFVESKLGITKETNSPTSPIKTVDEELDF